ncbi:MAG: hypothetical protein AUJ60_05700 [Nitrospirae bacterium CG1_02_44_142]|nr:MAG: hypothetical protein AUJ60_05700 [Nitrospirae bacterium CG1_02_44_142]
MEFAIKDSKSFWRRYGRDMEDKKKRMAIIASKGTLDMAYPPVILASTAAAMDVEVGIFFTL